MNDTSIAHTSYDTLAQKAIDRADDAIGSARKAADDALDSVQEKVSRAGDRTVSYIKDEPVKSVLIAAAAGAAIATLIGLVVRTKTVERC